MSSVKEIDRQLESLKNELKNVKGTETEVYTRIVGYYRSVRNWNKGKREEYNYKILFKQPEAESLPNSITKHTCLV